MKVAIMGAGMSGLSCAITLERNGITPVIFENRSMVGDRFVNAEAMFCVLNRPFKDEIKYLSENCHIDLKPVDVVEKLTIHSKNETGNIEGKIGYTNIRGRHKNSYESQLARQVKSEINYNSTYDYAYLCKNFDYVVLATGDGQYSSAIGNYKCDLTVTIKGATIEGNFITKHPHVWFDYDVLPKGYAWIIPFSEKEANLVIAYPDYPDNLKLDVDVMWQKAYDLACKNLKQSFRITDKFEITRYMMGICNKAKIDNTYFAGNCFGTISPGLGFGQFASILTGVYAAYDICNIGVYEELTKPLFENYNHSLVFRRFLESLTNEQMDIHIKNLDSKILDSLIDKICSTDGGIDLLKISTPLMRLWNNYKEHSHNK
ncbi:NAD(P)/FAD-dependent oxidoreductase [Clostridium sp. YIM B02505]|uniref:NAD(P)/FAD-dependent oxidoreductase n=1 Tax=Clostridium yunnanense TaxID=2800325 RepID=A0ABS1EWU6_9CLOT|nr:NAD(P)/FAD-dependent oxidoreductase [Clostridium yunnanense]MBK1813847.1 NAD(P)/FAD-dependent oxidoreductase [Clostridium yunnanense]